MRRFPLLLLLAFTLVGCNRDAERDKAIEQQFYVFGTVVSLTLYDVDDQKAAEAGAGINAMFRQMHDDWHAWQKGALTELNAGIAAGRPVKVHPSLIPLIEKSKRAYSESDGLFNPAIGKLIGLWGFHSSQMPAGPLPPEQAIGALLAAHPSMDDVQLKDGVVTSRNRAVQMDFGGIAKGYAVERALERLRQMGIRNAIVNTGGGLGVIGSHGERPWMVGIRHPLGDGVLARLAVHDGEHVHTSGNYERFREWEGKRYSHIIDPRSGWPVQEVVSTTVIYNDGALADAFTKPFIVGGTKEWYAFAKKLGVKSVMLVDAQGTVYMTPAMAERVQFQGTPKTVISPPVD